MQPQRASIANSHTLRHCIQNPDRGVRIRIPTRETGLQARETSSACESKHDDPSISFAVASYNATVTSASSSSSDVFGDPAPTNHITSVLTSDMTDRPRRQVFLDFGKPEPRLTTSPHREALRQKGHHRGNQTFCHQNRLMICCPVLGSVGRSSFGEPYLPYLTFPYYSTDRYSQVGITRSSNPELFSSTLCVLLRRNTQCLPFVSPAQTVRSSLCRVYMRNRLRNTYHIFRTDTKLFAAIVV
ncbi:hypothetical protein BDP81DRAFT_72842 [Colletotrichum phormii]|uniref:Uncharacterized protein n=1 Tax=Colletotrichum phormii TaxID=359342 RepID=A0AAI9ZJY8_9PEZI|nr:uncharacterized protein BDP81DRAFT_72842 [Colletotrichum phormii]KAK1633372.1 hypothetical protein BDP81DRAFT_72842 [Colletotrichum phormii]